MAQIRVEEKRSGLGWLWSVLALIIAAALVWYFLTNRSTLPANTNKVPTDTATQVSVMAPGELT